MDAKKENCPSAFRRPGDKSVQCRKVAEENPDAKWTFCAHQYFCSMSGRFEAAKSPKDCVYRRGGK